LDLPILVVVNLSSIPDTELDRAIDIINRRIEADFRPIWGGGYACERYASADGGAAAGDFAPDAQVAVFVVDPARVDEADRLSRGFANGAKLGFVVIGEGDWTVDLSHQVLEFIVADAGC
jgi:hypothetical protein